MPGTDAQGWEEGSVKKKRTRSKPKKTNSTPPPKRRPLSKEFHQNKQNQRLDSHNSKMAGKKKPAARKSAARGTKKQKQTQRNTRASSKEEKKRRAKRPGFDTDSPSEYEATSSDEEEQPDPEEEQPDREEEEDAHKEEAPKPEKPKAKSPKTSSKSSPNPKEPSGNSNKADLEAEVARLKKRAEVQENLPKIQKSASNPADLTALEKEVVKVTKTALWHQCKFIKGPKLLRKGSNFVLKKINFQIMDGMTLKEKALFEEDWYGKNSNLVRTGLNAKRNFVQNEMRAGYIKVFEAGNKEDWPSKGDILAIAMRDVSLTGIDKGADDYEAALEAFDLRLANYWDTLLVKACDMAYWNPNKRHYGNPSTHKEPEGSNSNLNEGTYYVDESSEAFLVWSMENAYDKWYWKIRKKQLAKEVEAGTITAAKMEEHRLEDEATSYTDANGGQQKWGGITPKGRARFTELVTMIKENQVDSRWVDHSVLHFASLFAR